MTATTPYWRWLPIGNRWWRRLRRYWAWEAFHCAPSVPGWQVAAPPGAKSWAVLPQPPGPQARHARGHLVHSLLGPPTVRPRRSNGGRWRVRPSLDARELPLQSGCSVARYPPSTTTSFARSRSVLGGNSILCQWHPFCLLIFFPCLAPIAPVPGQRGCCSPIGRCYLDA
jgi:hypothetical protein